MGNTAARVPGRKRVDKTRTPEQLGEMKALLNIRDSLRERYRFCKTALDDIAKDDDRMMKVWREGVREGGGPRGGPRHSSHMWVERDALEGLCKTFIEVGQYCSTTLKKGNDAT